MTPCIDTRQPSQGAPRREKCPTTPPIFENTTPRGNSTTPVHDPWRSDFQGGRVGQRRGQQARGEPRRHRIRAAAGAPLALVRCQRPLNPPPCRCGAPSRLPGPAPPLPRPPPALTSVPRTPTAPPRAPGSPCGRAEDPGGVMNSSLSKLFLLIAAGGRRNLRTL